MKLKIILIIILLLLNFPLVQADDFGPLVPISGSVLARVWNESNMSQSIPFDIFITNEEGTQTYQQKDCLYTVLMNTSDLPFGDKTIFVLKSSGYKMRIYYIDITPGINYTFDFYLPPYEAQLAGSPPSEESKTKMDVEVMTNPALNLVIPMTYISTEIIGVYIYNISSTYGTWESVPNSLYTYNSAGPNVSIDSSLLNANITMGRIDYYYKYEEGTVMETPLYIITVVGPQGEFTSPPIEDAKLEFKRYNEYNDTWVNVSIVYTDANGQVDIYLVPHELYKVKITKDDYTTEFADYIPSSSIYTHTFRIYPTSTVEDVHFVSNVLACWVNWTSNESGLFGIYDDFFSRTTWVNFTIMNYSDDVVLYWGNHTANFFNDSNYTHANHSLPYKWRFVIKHEFWNQTVTISGIIFPWGEALTNISDLEYYLHLIFGDSPIQNADTGESVGWVYIVIGAIGFLILVSVGSYHAELGFGGMGIWFICSYFIISGVNLGILVGGILIIGLAFLAGLRSK